MRKNRCLDLLPIVQTEIIRKHFEGVINHDASHFLIPVTAEIFVPFWLAIVFARLGGILRWAVRERSLVVRPLHDHPSTLLTAPLGIRYTYELSFTIPVVYTHSYLVCCRCSVPREQ